MLAYSFYVVLNKVIVHAVWSKRKPDIGRLWQDDFNIKKKNIC